MVQQTNSGHSTVAPLSCSAPQSYLLSPLSFSGLAIAQEIAWALWQSWLLPQVAGSSTAGTSSALEAKEAQVPSLVSKQIFHQ